MLDDILFYIQQCWWRMWNGGIKLLWYRIFPAKDAHHPSLEMDERAIIPMNPKQLEAYRADLRERRRCAYEKELS